METSTERTSTTRKRNPLIRTGAVRRMMATGVVGAAVTATTLLGAGSATAADSVVLQECTSESESSAFGQSIVAGPQTLDAKVEQAMLLVYPLEFDRAKQARQEFLSSGSIAMGSVTEEEQNFSGKSLADAFADQVRALPAAGDRGEVLQTHVSNLAAVGCLGGARVPGQERPAPPPPSPEPEPAPEPAPEPSPEPSTSRSYQPDTAPGTATSPPATGAGSSYGAAAPVRVLPPEYEHVPGSQPPWADTRFGEAPGTSPEIGDLVRESEEQRRADASDAEVRAAGNAEAVPAYQGDRVELPVLIAAISLAGVTAALVRTWVLRRG